MELRQITIFRAVAEERHFGRAARRLFLAQASVSGALQKLEAELGFRLLHRTSRQVELTPAGRVFFAETTAVEAMLERAVLRARDVAGGGTLRIATNYPASRLLLLPLLERLRRETSNLSTVLRELGTADQLRALALFELDLGLLYGPVRHPDIQTVRLLEVPIVANVRPGHPLADRGVVTFADVAAYPFRAGGSAAIEAAVAAAAATTGTVLEAPAVERDPDSFLLQIETTDAIGFSSLPRGEQNRGNGLTVLRLGPREPRLEIHAAWNRHRDEHSVKTIVDALLEVAQDPRSDG